MVSAAGGGVTGRTGALADVMVGADAAVFAQLEPVLRRFAENVVHVGGPGAVARCHSCRGLLAVFVEVRGVTCVDLRGLESLEPA